MRNTLSRGEQTMFRLLIGITKKEIKETLRSFLLVDYGDEGLNHTLAVNSQSYPQDSAVRSA